MRADEVWLKNPGPSLQQGNCNLVDAAKQKGIKKFVLMSSLLTNGAAVGQRFNPGYIILNLFGNVLVQKLAVCYPADISKSGLQDVTDLVLAVSDTSMCLCVAE